HRRLADATQRLEEQHPQRQLTSRMRRLAALDERLQAATRATPMRAQARLAASRQRLAGSGLDHRLAQARRRVDHHISRIGAAMTSASHDRDRHLSMLSAQLDALSPLRTLARGYAICWDASHTRLVRSVAAVMPGDRIHVQLPDGELQCAVDDSPSTAAPRP
nr:hypothetical protein [Acidobacteriota bacterium]